MATYGIWQATDESYPRTNLSTHKVERMAISADLEGEDDFDSGDFFLVTGTPDRLGEIDVEGDDEWLDEYFSVMS